MTVGELRKSPIWPRPETLECPSCQTQMSAGADYHEGLDEKSDGRMYPWAYWSCPSCSHKVHEYDDDFVFVDDDVKP